MESIYATRIANLRSLMRTKSWDAVVITGSDPHDSEYPSQRWKQVQWISGFTGEAGDIVITEDHVGLWTDSRYFIQASAQLQDTGGVLHKTRVPDQVLIPEWLSGELGAGSTIAVDSYCVSSAFVEELENLDLEVIGVQDILSPLWEDRPCIPQTSVYTVDCGDSLHEKLDWIREELSKNGCDAIFLPALDEIAWLLNARASDIEYNPFVLSYLLITAESVKWFVIKEEIEDPETAAALEYYEENGIEVLPYSDAQMHLADCGRLWVDKNRINFATAQALGSDIYDAKSPIALKKSVKTPKEIEAIEKALFEDGIAMEKFLYWLEKSLAADKTVSEWDALVKLEQLRAEGEGYRDGSFETISAYGESGALPHYVTPSEAAPILKPEGLYLCDSGGQYYSENGPYGTTDLTRTIPLGPCTDLEMEDYTLVMKGHIDLAMSVFPADTSGSQLDALARMPLWRYHRNFGHGTGHGVGCFLGVHEGPCEFRHNHNPQPLVPGMILSDEPGIYREGLHGVRHENLVLVEDDETNEFGHFLRLRTITLCHYDTSALIPEMLSEDEKAWLNEYNAAVYEKLAPKLPLEVAEWLKVKTAAI